MYRRCKDQSEGSLLSRAGIFLHSTAKCHEGDPVCYDGFSLSHGVLRPSCPLMGTAQNVRVKYFPVFVDYSMSVQLVYFVSSELDPTTSTLALAFTARPVPV